jgi:alpha-beta hydrolase superfamily lysophospholipase
LPNVTVPILVQHGAHDAVCPVGNAHRYARLAGSSDVTVAVYNESAHVLLADAEASRVVSDARAFVARHAPL